MRFNKGEWSELYLFLVLLCDGHLNIVDSKLNLISRNIYKVIELILGDYRYMPIDDKINKAIDDLVVSEYKIDEIRVESKRLLDVLINQKSSNGSFGIGDIAKFANEMLGSKVKAKSTTKIDLTANILDIRMDRQIELSYSIKSNIGNPPTLLNSSSNTNFIYKIDNINDLVMIECNKISTKTKLIDKYNFLISNSANIEFLKIQSDVFKYNVKMIDSNLDKILARILLMSYSMNIKELNVLLSEMTTDSLRASFYKKKISDFVNAISFGMMAGKYWNGHNEVTGGILLVDKVGNVSLLDLIYYKHEVEKYLIENIRLDSPSSTRYKMFEVYKEDGQYFFKLNLQIRFR